MQNALFQTRKTVMCKPGRPFKTGPKMQKISLSLPAELIEQLEQEAKATSADSVSAIARLALGDYLRRIEKRRDAGRPA